MQHGILQDMFKDLVKFFGKVLIFILHNSGSNFDVFDETGLCYQKWAQS